MEDFVTVITSAYNAEKYIAEAIESVLEQSHPNFEFIIINDGSKDDTLKVIQKYAAQDSRIIVDDHENMGKEASVNRVLPQVKGKYIALLDADDAMLPNRLEEQIQYLKNNPEVTMTSAYCYFINEHSQIVGVQKLPGFESIEECKASLSRNKPALCAQTAFMCYTQAFLEVGGYRSTFPADDLDLFTRMVEQGNILVSPPKILGKYRIHGKSVMASKNVWVQYRSSWVIDSMIRRRSNQPELTFEEYMKIKKSEPLLKRWNRERKYYAYHYYRNAGIDYVSRRYFRSFTSAIISFILRPSLILDKAVSQIKSRRMALARKSAKLA